MVLVLALIFTGMEGLSADNPDVKTAIALSKKLNELKMFDYSLYLLEKTMQENPSEADVIKIQIGLTQFTNGKIDDGEKTINSIASSSPYYPDSRRVMGIEAIKRAKLDIGITALEGYFKVKLADPPKDEDGKNDFIEALNYLLYCYKEKGQATEAAKVVKYREALAEKDETTQSPFGDREGMLLSIQTKLDTAEKLKEDGKTGWQPLANDAFKPLEELLWAGIDSIAALSYVEKTRALYILERYSDALQILTGEKTAAIINGFDEGYKKERIESQAPSVLATFIEGRIYQAQAAKASSDEEKIKLNGKAVQKFYSILLKHEKFPKYEEVISGFSDCREKLEKLGKKITIPEAVLKKLSRVVSFKKKEADRLYQDGKFAQAIPPYLEEIKKSRTGAQASENISILAYCYVKTDQALEAMALASYLGDYFPRYEKTPATLLQTGEYLWKKNEISEAMVLYRHYLKTCPTDQYAGAISARVAKYFYDKAADLAKQAKTLPIGQERASKNNEARQAFVDAIPYYKNIIGNFQHTEYGTSSFYLLGWCYFNSRQYFEAAQSFLDFCARESKAPKDKIQLGDIADAKLRTAEAYFQFADSKEKEAKALKEKALMLEAVQLPVRTEKEKGIPEILDDDTNKPAPAAEKEMTAEDAKKKVQELEADSIKYYKETLKQCEEFVQMTSKGGILDSDISKKTTSAKESISALTGWAYDGLNEKEKAVEYFKKFISAYPQGKQTPVSMSRLGVLYGEINKFEDAAKILEELSVKFPDSKEGKQAVPTLAKSMYEIKKYEKSIEVFRKMLDQKAEISISDLRWVAENLSDCGGTHPKTGAETALMASQILLNKIEKPELTDWIGKVKAAEIAAKPNEQKNIIGIIKEKLLFDSAAAAYWSGIHQDAVNYLDALLKNDKTPYFYQAKFSRGLAYRALKNYKNALSDYSDITMAAMGAKKNSVYFKAQCMIGDTYIDQNEFKNALGAFNMLAITDIDSWSGDDRVKELPIEERAGQMEWIEYAVYKAAICYAKLGSKDEKQKLLEKYKKYFPKGKFKEEIDKL